MQTRFELIIGTQGDKFINLCKKINSHLEFGLQTAIESESNIIDRKNNINTVREVLNRLNVNDISYEVSLIYGLPMQTVQSFKESIDFLMENGCKSIVAYPLMLLKGTELYSKRNKYSFVEKKLGSYNIPTVISSNTFTEKEWMEMETIAKQLNLNSRI
jgi:radical SAM superfamily enzyme